MENTNNLLSVLDGFTLDNQEDIAKTIAEDFRQRRIERGLTREEIAVRAGVALSNVTRFEQKGLISLGNLISLAMAMEYTSELRNVFSQPKYSTMEELTRIRKNKGKKRAYKSHKERNDED